MDLSYFFFDYLVGVSDRFLYYKVILSRSLWSDLSGIHGLLKWLLYGLIGLTLLTSY